jgi:peptidyl-prolyl cis-trans isomerase A (cyclophilin A)
MRFALTALLVCSSVWAQTGTAPKSAAPAKSSTAKSSSTKAKSTAKGPQLPDLLKPETLKAKAPSIFIVRLETSKGNVDIRVVKSWAPNGVERFYNLVKAGYYDNNYFFRVLPFMAQVGISSRAEVNRVWADRTIFDDRVIQTNKRGTVAYGMLGGVPNSRSTQFFINKKDENTYLDGYKFAPFGEVVAGMEFVDMIYGGYGEPDVQGEMTAHGDAIVKSQYPRMDRIVKATILTVVEP